MAGKKKQKMVGRFAGSHELLYLPVVVVVLDLNLGVWLGRLGYITHDGSMGLVYLPIHDLVGFYGFHVGKYTIHGWYG